ncbi:MAG: IclR family transcriptional regulator domain-containing protein [Acetobacteraceae bacterium]
MDMHQPHAVVPDFEDSPDYIQSLHRGLGVIRTFDADHSAMSLAEVATRAGFSRPVVRRLLMTLEYLGYVSRDGRWFSLTPRVLDLGFSYLSSLTVAQLALPYMEELSHQVAESCSLAVLEDHDIVYVQRVAARKVMTISISIGARLPAHCTSMGRALVANLDDEARSRWLRTLRLQERTRFTLTDSNNLQRELDRVRTQGYAYVEQELEEGLCSVAVPIHGSGGEILAALNVGMPFIVGARARALKEVLPAVRATAQRIEQQLPTRPARREAPGRQLGSVMPAGRAAWRGAVK